jgi:hypothetical protein
MYGEPDGGDGTQQRHGYQNREEQEKPEQTPQSIAHTHSRGILSRAGVAQRGDAAKESQKAKGKSQK